MNAYKARLELGTGIHQEEVGHKAVPINDGEFTLILPRVGHIWLFMTPQLPFYIVDTLSESLADKLREFKPDVIVGVASLGWEWASRVARLLGHEHYVPITKTRKFWYNDAKHAQQGESITGSSDATLYLPPEVEARLKGQRVAIVDDVLCQGGSLIPAIELVEAAQCEVVVAGVVLTEGDAWQNATEYPIVRLGHIPLAGA